MPNQLTDFQSFMGIFLKGLLDEVSGLFIPDATDLDVIADLNGKEGTIL